MYLQQLGSDHISRLNQENDTAGRQVAMEVIATSLLYLPEWLLGFHYIKDRIQLRGASGNARGPKKKPLAMPEGQQKRRAVAKLQEQPRRCSKVTLPFVLTYAWMRHSTRLVPKEIRTSC